MSMSAPAGAGASAGKTSLTVNHDIAIIAIPICGAGRLAALIRLADFGRNFTFSPGRRANIKIEVALLLASPFGALQRKG